MNINTEKFGEIQFEGSSVIFFIEGILGFPKNKKYVLINAEENSPFKWLQSIDDSTLTFLVVDPCVCKPDYKATVSKKVKEELSIESEDDYIVLVIVVVHKDPRESTANLMGPLILNTKSKRAKQIVLGNTDYPTRYKLIGEKSDGK